MSKKLNISVLVAARDEYIEQLKCIICPLILQGFNSIYSDALKITDGKNTLYKFQELLKDIPKWNQTILQEESKRIKKKCPYIMDIVTAIFVSNVKILASIRLRGKNENIKVKIPTSDIFIHSIYIEAAQRIFYNPYLFFHKITNNNFGKIEVNKYEIIQIIKISVDETIRQMLPFDEILQEYLVNALNDNADKSSGSDDSSDDSSVDSDDDYIKGDKIINNSDIDDSDEYDEKEESKSNFIDGSDHSDEFSDSGHSDLDLGNEQRTERTERTERTIQNTFNPYSTNQCIDNIGMNSINNMNTIDNLNNSTQSTQSTQSIPATPITQSTQSIPATHAIPASPITQGTQGNGNEGMPQVVRTVDEYDNKHSFF